MSETSSLFSLPESLRESLFCTKGSRRHQALTNDYHWPADQVASVHEVLVSAAMQRIYPNRLFYEPDPGYLDRIFASSEGQIRILDLGSGLTAAWALAMAERYPDAEVIGVDIVPTDLLYLPPNLTTEIHDLLEGVPFPDDYFDLIHSRNVGAASFLGSPSSPFIDDVARCLKPGGVFLSEAPHNMSDLFHSHKGDTDPMLAIVCAQNTLRVDAIKRSREGEALKLACGTRIAREVQRNEVLGREMTRKLIEVPIGAREDEEDSGECQLGTIYRQAMLLSWEMNDVRAGLDEDLIRERKKVDEVVLPEKDVGLYCLIDIVWAEKKVGSPEIR